MRNVPSSTGCDKEVRIKINLTLPFLTRNMLISPVVIISEYSCGKLGLVILLTRISGVVYSDDNPSLKVKDL